MTSFFPEKVKFDKAVFRNRLLSWYDAESIDHPWRSDWRKTNSPYFVWLSEIMLQQTTIAAVRPKYLAFVKEFPDLKSVAQAEESAIKKAVQGLGYYRRFSFFHRAAKEWLNGGKHWPETYDQWLSVSGVGPYTAAALASITLSEAKPVVDGNVERVLSRVFAVPGPVNEAGKKEDYYRIANRLVSKSRPGDYNQAVMQLGQLICTPTSPNCKQCPVEEYCQSKKRNLQKEIPAPKAKKEKTQVELALLLDKKDSRIALLSRPKSSRFLKEQTGFPTAIKNQKTGKWHLNNDEGRPLTLSKSKVLGQYKHTITHHAITTTLYEYDLKSDETFYVEANELKDHLIASLDLKALRFI